MRKKLVALFAVLTLVLGMSLCVSAATSPADAPEAKKATVTAQSVTFNTAKDGTASTAKATKKNVVIPRRIEVAGVKYKLTKFNKNSFGAKVRVIKLACPKGVKASRYTFAKKTFAKVNTKKVKFVVSKNMSKKEFKKFVKKLRKVGFKGTIKRSATAFANIYVK